DLEILARELLELETELAGELRRVPEHVAELAGDRGPALVGDDPAVVADRLLRVLGDLARLAGEAECGVREPRRARVLRGAPGEALVVREIQATILDTAAAAGVRGASSLR